MCLLEQPLDVEQGTCFCIITARFLARSSVAATIAARDRYTVSEAFMYADIFGYAFTYVFVLICIK